MLDRDWGELYQVEELEEWKSQIVISNKEVMGIRKMPFAFTEQGGSKWFVFSKKDMKTIEMIAKLNCFHFGNGSTVGCSQVK